MKASAKSSVLAIVSVLTFGVIVGNHAALAHDRSRLATQAAACFWDWGGGYSEYIRCGYGKTEVHFQNTYATDLDRDTHCAYGKRYIRSTGRYVEVKSCGGTVRRWASDNGYGNFASCVTGHWYCYWRD